MLVDDLVSTVGSANMDIRSFSLNFGEIHFYNEAINKELKEQFERIDLEDCMGVAGAVRAVLNG